MPWGSFTKANFFQLHPSCLILISPHLFVQSLLTSKQDWPYLSFNSLISSMQSEQGPGLFPWTSPQWTWNGQNGLGIFWGYLTWCRAESCPKSALPWPLLVLGSLKICEEFWAISIWSCHGLTPAGNQAPHSSSLAPPFCLPSWMGRIGKKKR